MPLLSRAAKVAYVLVLAAMAVSGLALLVEHVGGGKTPASASSSSTTTTVKTGGTTTTGISTTTSPVPSAPQPSAATAAAALISSWASGNQAEALTVATPPAVATLFAVHYTSGLAIDRGCSVANTIVCTYGPPGGAAPTDPIYEVYVSQAGADWYVDSVRIEN
jgi:hypothetical protein